MEYRNLLKLSQSLKAYDIILGGFIQKQISIAFKENQTETNIEVIRRFIDASQRNANLLHNIIKDFQTQSQSPQQFTKQAIRNAYYQSGKAKIDIVNSTSNYHSLVSCREASKENLVYNMPITQEMRNQLLKNSSKYASLYDSLFLPNYEDFIEPNKPLIYFQNS